MYIKKQFFVFENCDMFSFNYMWGGAYTAPIETKMRKRDNFLSVDPQYKM
jgi:hypothetical protein